MQDGLPARRPLWVLGVRYGHDLLLLACIVLAAQAVECLSLSVAIKMRGGRARCHEMLWPFWILCGLTTRVSAGLDQIRHNNHSPGSRHFSHSTCTTICL